MGRWAQQKRRGSHARGAADPPCWIVWAASPLYQGATQVEVFYSDPVTAAHFDPASFVVVIAGVRIHATTVTQGAVDTLNYFAAGFAAIVGGESTDQIYGPPEFCAPQSGIVDT